MKTAREERRKEVVVVCQSARASEKDVQPGFPVCLRERGDKEGRQREEGLSSRGESLRGLARRTRVGSRGTRRGRGLRLQMRDVLQRQSGGAR